MERQVLGAADHVVVAWPGMVELLSPTIRDKTTTVTCSFDSDDFKGAVDSRKDKFRITYIGSFYAAQQPTNFLSAMRKLLEDGRIPVEEVELVFVGQTRKAGFVDFEGTILDKVMKRVGFVCHQESIEYVRGTDVLLLIVSTERGKEDIPGKTFEFLASGRLVLALVPPDGATADLIRKTNTGIVVAPEDIAAIHDAVLDLYLQWKQGGLKIWPNWTEVFKYEARNLSQSLSGVLDRVMISAFG
jgi:glycosyltransferase involved in cell wall biosynthesis